MRKKVYYSELEFIDPKPLRLFEKRSTLSMPIAGLYATRKLAKEAAEKKRMTVVDYWNWKTRVYKTVIDIHDGMFA